MFTILSSSASIRIYLRPILALLLMCLASVPAEAAAPVLKALEPRGAQRGQAFKLTLVGEFLQPGAEISASLPGTFSKLTPSPEKGETELPVLMQLREDAVPGLYPIRVRTEDGFSNVLLFSIGMLPETIEEESLLKEGTEKTIKNNNDSQLSAQKITVPIDRKSVV